MTDARDWRVNLNYLILDYYLVISADGMKAVALYVVVLKSSDSISESLGL